MTMASFEDDKINQGWSLIRPPLFHASNFAHWKKFMQIFIKDLNYEFWEIISKGNLRPTMKEGDKIVIFLL